MLTGRVKTTVLAALMLVFAPLPFAEADPTIAAQPEDHVLEPFEFGGVTHYIQYHPDMGVVAAAVRESLETSIAYLQSAWGSDEDATLNQVPFQVYVEVLTFAQGSDLAAAVLEAPDVLPDGAAALTPQVCWVLVFEPFDQVAIAPAVFAHELAHCYQTYYVPAEDATPDEVERWWTEGTAEWLATLVYPQMGGDYLASLGRPGWFITSHNQRLFDQSYNTVYFWRFLASPEGLGSVSDVIGFLKGLPVASSVGDYIDYFEAASGDFDALLHRYALALAREQVAFQPLRDDLIGPRVIDVGPLPSTQTMQTEAFSVEFYEFLVVDIAADTGVQLDTAGLTASNSRADILSGQTTVPLLEGSPVEVCPIPPSLMVAMSRGESTAGGEVTLNISHIDEPCESEPPAELPACVVGEWHVAALPAAITDVLNYDIDLWTINIAADGTLWGAFDVTSTMPDVPGMAVDIAGSYEGTMQLLPDPTDPTRYDVIHSTGYYSSFEALMTLNGETQDVTGLVETFLQDGVSFIPVEGFYRCLDNGHLLYSVTAQGMTLDYRLARTP